MGAAAVNAHGEILSQKFHAGAGTPHAEALVIMDCRARGILSEIHTLLVTLEPCNHTGRTPPCTQAILGAGIKQVFYGTPDPNPKVPGGGGAFLCSQSVRAELFPDAEIQTSAENLIRAFTHWSKTGLPWVSVKQAFDPHGLMIPPPGKKTFTSPASLTLAHELRKRADVILTGSGTVLADLPEFTVRHVSDHTVITGRKPRIVAILDRRGRVKREAPGWLRGMEEKGIPVRFFVDVNEALSVLGGEGVLEILVEAGPTLSGAVLASGIWNESITIRQDADGRDHVQRDYRENSKD